MKRALFPLVLAIGCLWAGGARLRQLRQSRTAPETFACDDGPSILASSNLHVALTGCVVCSDAVITERINRGWVASWVPLETSAVACANLRDPHTAPRYLLKIEDAEQNQAIGAIGSSGPIVGVVLNGSDFDDKRGALRKVYPSADLTGTIVLRLGPPPSIAAIAGYLGVGLLLLVGTFLMLKRGE